MGLEHDGGIDPKVFEIVGGYRTFINERPALLSLLYDINMLPEQTVSMQGAIRLAAFCEVWKKGEDGELADAAKPQKTGLDVDALAQEIRRVDGNHSLGAGALAEALMPFLQKATSSTEETRRSPCSRPYGPAASPAGPAA
ncbi:hypothetical protein OIU34_20760 [Pararhizobium sp. BT-229]|uniref:hypothetical protein n=1 Tax=Pararhizobium sp. BT-229 TaxID=2986923 RepID=UPI0021F7E96A|nr:hypothetical protein [Pararhizobium sp. BT-229]MCV9964322.1 hypothetical protein [Pararhizobium sp. BT-229]